MVNLGQIWKIFLKKVNKYFAFSIYFEKFEAMWRYFSSYIVSADNVNCKWIQQFEIYKKYLVTINSPGSQWKNDSAGTLEYFIKPSGLEYFITFSVTHHRMLLIAEHEMEFLHISTKSHLKPNQIAETHQQ